MGGICCAREVTPQQLTNMLEIALSRCGFPELTDDQRNEINNMILWGPSKEIKMDRFQVFFQKKNQGSEQNEAKRNERLVYCPINASTYRGLIIYEDGYYLGEIDNLKAQSQNGTSFYFSQKGRESATQYIIEGIWERDCLKRGKISVKADGSIRQLYEIERKGQQGFIKFANDTDNDMVSYDGTIKWEKIGMKEALTGQGKIQFKDGSVYTGGIKNGLMDTQVTQKSAIFKTREQTEVYEGPYKEGMREGLGQIQLKQGVMKYVCNMNWIKGRPDIQTMTYQDRDVRDTCLRSTSF